MVRQCRNDTENRNNITYLDSVLITDNQKTVTMKLTLLQYTMAVYKKTTHHLVLHVTDSSHTYLDYATKHCQQVLQNHFLYWEYKMATNAIIIWLHTRQYSNNATPILVTDIQIQNLGQLIYMCE